MFPESPVTCVWGSTVRFCCLFGILIISFLFIQDARKENERKRKEMKREEKSSNLDSTPTLSFLNQCSHNSVCSIPFHYISLSLSNQRVRERDRNRDRENISYRSIEEYIGEKKRTIVIDLVTVGGWWRWWRLRRTQHNPRRRKRKQINYKNQVIFFDRCFSPFSAFAYNSSVLSEKRDQALALRIDSKTKTLINSSISHFCFCHSLLCSDGYITPLFLHWCYSFLLRLGPS